MRNHPLVSICIPTYNGALYLKECIDSCVMQSFRDYEIVICDDGSTDATWNILETYAAKHPAIRLFRNEKNLGLVGNWNRCIEKAHGEWIKLVFQDDFIFPNCLERFVAAIEQGQSLLVCERNFVLPKNASEEQKQYYNTGVKTLRNTGYPNRIHFSPKHITSIAVSHMAMNVIGEPTLTMFSKSLVAKYGGFTDRLRQICDLEFFLRVSSCQGLTYLPEKLCGFRIHEGSTTSTNIGNKYYELRYIEPLVFSYILLFDEHYRPFRKHLNLLQRLKLQLYFRVKAYQAHQVAQREGIKHPLFQDEHHIKKIYEAREGNWLTRLVALIKK